MSERVWYLTDAGGLRVYREGRRIFIEETNQDATVEIVWQDVPHLRNALEGAFVDARWLDRDNPGRKAIVVEEGSDG